MEDLLWWLAARPVEEVVVPGVLDRADGNAVRLWTSHVHVGSPERGYLCAGDPGRSAQLSLTAEDSLSRAERHVGRYADPAEGEEYVPVHLGGQFLSHGAPPLRLTRARYALGPRSDPGGGVVEWLELLLDDRDPLPLNWDGLVLGGAGAYERWYASRSEVHRRELREVVWYP
ncbi:hypothetical protein [Nocardiopsis deserti]|uniref:hypothetical protein n=1 Tax=Nocardiopsis deserti TaxID=2605988 RepID=UPI001238BB08|nr:hypothetical protein [Nocardiopsis deserti]